jgi:hypothetical protein
VEFGGVIESHGDGERFEGSLPDYWHIYDFMQTIFSSDWLFHALA